MRKYIPILNLKFLRNFITDKIYKIRSPNELLCVMAWFKFIRLKNVVREGYKKKKNTK